MTTAKKTLKQEASATIDRVKGEAKVAYDKSAAVASTVGGYTKDNTLAVVESGKILGTGVRKVANDIVVETLSVPDVMIADWNKLVEAKSIKDIMSLQMGFLRRNCATVLGRSMQHGSALVGVAKDAAAPLSKRVDTTIAAIQG